MVSIADQICSFLHVTDGTFPQAEDIAREMGLSRTHLSKILKKEVGLSLKQFLDQERIARVKTMLQLSDLSITEISY